MRVRDVMTTPAVFVRRDDFLSDVVLLMMRTRVSGVPVVDDHNVVVGIMSEGDLLRRLNIDAPHLKERCWATLFTRNSVAQRERPINNRPVDEVMTEKVVTIEASDTLRDAARLMYAFRTKRLPVTIEGQLVGMLTRADLVKALGLILAPEDAARAISDDEVVTRICDEIARYEAAVPEDACATTKVEGPPRQRPEQRPSFRKSH